MGPAEKEGKGEREREGTVESTGEMLLKRVGIAVFCSRHALRVRSRLLRTEERQTDSQTDGPPIDQPTDPSEQTSNRWQTGCYTPYERKFIVNEPPVLSLSRPFPHVAYDNASIVSETTPTVAGIRLKSPSRAFDALRPPSCPFRAPPPPRAIVRDTDVRFEQDRPPIRSNESGIRTRDKPEYACFFFFSSFSTNGTRRALLHASLASLFLSFFYPLSLTIPVLAYATHTG